MCITFRVNVDFTHYSLRIAVLIGIRNLKDLDIPSGLKEGRTMISYGIFKIVKVPFRK